MTGHGRDERGPVPGRLAVTGDSELVAWLINRWHGVQTIEDAVCWELIRKDDDKDELLVVAAPGVQISVPQDPNPWWEWTIVRVQDPALVPNWGERIMLDVLLPSRSPLSRART
ncbi:MAG: hypothetical protein IPN52_12270 [Micrococcales bacterium]|nr:hypothetical protein [Micrococcales bacterium]